VTRIAIDGIDAAGKTTLADRRGARLQAERVCIDDFLRPERERYSRGVDSPEGYYQDSFDLDAFRTAVLAAAPPVVADGVFLERASWTTSGTSASGSTCRSTSRFGVL
jgi:uridine kinase